MTLIQDLRYALRGLRRNAGLTLVIVASLAIGIGANTAIFSVVNALLLKPLPYPDADRLAVLWLRSPGINIPQDWPSPGQYIDVQNENHSFAEMSISQGRGGTLLPEPATGSRNASRRSRRRPVCFICSARNRCTDDCCVPRRTCRVSRRSSSSATRSGSAPSAPTRHRRQERHDERRRARTCGRTRTSSRSSACCGPDFLLNGEIMPTVASIRQMDVFLPLPLGAGCGDHSGAATRTSISWRASSPA